jgi:hypothetical protein
MYYNVTLRRVHETTVVVENSKYILHIYVCLRACVPPRKEEGMCVRRYVCGCTSAGV